MFADVTPFDVLRPLVFRLDPERAHRLTIAALKLAPAPQARNDARNEARHDTVLATRVTGLDFPSPVGLAAGFDKDAEVTGPMLTLGFGFVEVGTLTPLPQTGNPRPRLFRLPEDAAVINRMGFNNKGQMTARDRLQRARTGIVGVNIGANKDSTDRIADYALGVATMAEVADYLCVNISSPNTPGLRNLQSGGELVELLAAIRDARAPAGPPIWLKVAPDLDDAGVAGIVRAAIDHGIDAIVIGNTTVSRPPLSSRAAGEAGGLSGAPLAVLARDRLSAFARAAGGAIPLMAAGGIDSGVEAYARIRAGASLVQLYSALVYHGPGLAKRINRDLALLLARDGFSCVADAVGRGAV